MVKTRDFMTLLLARLKATNSRDLKKAPRGQVQKKKRYATPQVPSFRPKPPSYRPASNM